MGFNEILLIFSGACAGFIDSIAGGGGLITLPVLSLVLEPGAVAIGTNKIVGSIGAGIAFLVYLRKTQFSIQKAFVFSISVTMGSLIGSRVTPFLSQEFFRYFMICALPVLLWVIWRKGFWAERLEALSAPHPLLIGITGVCVGFYDGFFGPGGGTFMFLGLLLVVRLPLFEALTLSKFVNLLSASSSLVSYELQGFVHWKEGVLMACGMGCGAFLGARFTSKSAERMIRPALMIVVFLLILKLFFD